VTCRGLGQVLPRSRGCPATPATAPRLGPLGPAGPTSTVLGRPGASRRT